MIEEIYKNIYRIGVPLTGNPLKELNSYFIRGTDGDLLIDTGFRRDDCEQALAGALKELGSDPDRRLPCIHGVENGDILTVGDYHFQVILTPGHTPGNTMLWEAFEGIMFTGDNILFDITPNITFWDDMPDALGSYLDSLERSMTYPVRYAFPGHRKTGDYHERIKTLITHHEFRIAEALKVVREYPGKDASWIAGQMRWRIRASTWEDFPIVQKRFAVGEAIAHLDYLGRRGKIRSEINDKGIRIYFAV